MRDVGVCLISRILFDRGATTILQLTVKATEGEPGLACDLERVGRRETHGNLCVCEVQGLEVHVDYK